MINFKLLLHPHQKLQHTVRRTWLFIGYSDKRLRKALCPFHRPVSLQLSCHPIWCLLRQWLQESIQSQGMSMQHLSPAFGELCTCHQLGPTTGLDTAGITLANATDIVALASRSLIIAVANHDTILDFTQTLSPEGRCIF